MQENVKHKISNYLNACYSTRGLGKSTIGLSKKMTKKRQNSWMLSVMILPTNVVFTLDICYLEKAKCY